MIDLTTTPTSPWNESAADVFVADYIATQGLEDSKSNRELIRKAFLDRVKNILAADRLARAGAANKEMMKRLARRQQRKREVRTNLSLIPQTFLTPSKLYRRRYMTLLNHPVLRHHIRMLELFGVDAMSEDESDQPCRLYSHMRDGGYLYGIQPWRPGIPQTGLGDRRGGNISIYTYIQIYARAHTCKSVFSMK